MIVGGLFIIFVLVTGWGNNRYDNQSPQEYLESKYVDISFEHVEKYETDFGKTHRIYRSSDNLLVYLNRYSEGGRRNKIVTYSDNYMDLKDGHTYTEDKLRSNLDKLFGKGDYEVSSKLSNGYLSVDLFLKSDSLEIDKESISKVVEIYNSMKDLEFKLLNVLYLTELPDNSLDLLQLGSLASEWPTAVNQLFISTNSDGYEVTEEQISDKWIK